MISRELIVLAGGQGSRLQSVTGDGPKCLAPIAGKPFLHYLIRQYLRQGVKQFIFSLGKGADEVQDFLKTEYPGLDYLIHTEHQPLGTGGAIQACLSLTRAEHVWITNGDTLVEADMEALEDFHLAHNSFCTLLLTAVDQGERYGSVQTDAQDRIIRFGEKNRTGPSWINAGLYLLHTAVFQQLNLPKLFSWEKDFLESSLHQAGFFGHRQSGYFIDIGMPEDYYKAQNELIRHDS